MRRLIPPVVAIVAVMSGQAAAQSTITRSQEAGVTVYRGSASRSPVARSTVPVRVPVKKPVKTPPAIFTGGGGTPREMLPGGTFSVSRYQVIPYVIVRGGPRYLRSPRPAPRSGIRRQP